MIKHWRDRRAGKPADEKLAKGLKEFALASGIALSSQQVQAPVTTPTQGPTSAPVSAPSSSQEEQAPQDKMFARYPDFGVKPEDRFLWNIAQVESSGGKNFAHRKIASGMHRGDRAIGAWGLMPNTVREVLNRKKAKGVSLPPEIKKLKGMDHKQMKAYIESNPNVGLYLARSLARHVLNRQKGDHHRAAYAWFAGHNLFPSGIPQDFHQHYYINRYKEHDSANPLRQMETVSKSEPKQKFRDVFSAWKEKRRKIEAQRLESTNESYVYSDDYKPEGTPPPSVEEVLAQWRKDK